MKWQIDKSLLENYFSKEAKQYLCLHKILLEEFGVVLALRRFTIGE